MRVPADQIRARRRRRRAAPVVLLPRGDEPARVLRLRLGIALALYCGAVRIAAAAESSTWHWPEHLHVVWRADPRSLAVAALGAVPVGYFVAFGFRRRRAPVAAIAAGLALGILVEALAPGDERRPMVVAATALGSALAAGVFLGVSRRGRRVEPAERTLAVPELPLVGGAYVATPLLWLACSAYLRAGAGEPPWLPTLVALFGASLIGAARTSRGPARGGAARHAAAAAVWCAAGVAPLVVADARRGIALIALAAAFAAIHPAALGPAGRERRVEGPALRRTVPLLAAYLALASIGPVADTLAGRPGASATWAAIAFAIPPWGAAEQLTALVVLGYVVAGLNGRVEREGAFVSWSTGAPLVGAALVAGAGVAAGSLAAPLTQATLRGAVTFGACAMAAAIGVVLYRLQRRYARARAAEGRSAMRSVAPRAARGGERRTVAAVAWTEVQVVESAASR